MKSIYHTSSKFRELRALDFVELEKMGLEFAFSVSSKFAQRARKDRLRLALLLPVPDQMALLLISVAAAIALKWPLGSRGHRA